jgi:hypothetical protein
MTPQKLFNNALERVQLDPAVALLPPMEQAIKAAALLLMESPADVFAKAAAKMNEAFPPRVHTRAVTQAPKAFAAMQAAYAKLDSVAFVSEEGDTDDVKAALIDAMAALGAA